MLPVLSLRFSVIFVLLIITKLLALRFAILLRWDFKTTRFSAMSVAWKFLSIYIYGAENKFFINSSKKYIKNKNTTKLLNEIV